MSIVDEGPLSLLTSAIGFLEAPFDEAAHALRSWRRTQWLFLRFKKGQIQDARDVMARLFPMTNVGCREVLFETDSRWVAYLNDFLLGADVYGTTSYLSEKLGTRGIMAACSRDIGFGRKQISHHNVRFSLCGPKPNPILNDLRNVQVTSDYGGRKWTFHESGKPLDFERTDAYKAKRVRDRFTVAMLEEYMLAFGIRLRDMSFYGPRYAFLERRRRSAAAGRVITWAEAEEMLRMADSGE